MNVVILRGTLSRRPTVRELPSGDTLVAFEVTTRPDRGPALSAPVAWFDAPPSSTRLEPGTEVVVTGQVRRRFFRAGGTTASRTEVVADTVLPVTQKARVARALERARAIVDAPPTG